MVKNYKRKPSDRKKWVLIIEDALALGSSARRTLEQAGYRVYLAGSGEEAVECYKTARDCGYPFDAVVIPVSCVETAGGNDVIKRLYALDPDVRVITVGGDQNRRVAENSIVLGFKVALAKPFTGEELDRLLGLQLNFGAETA